MEVRLKQIMIEVNGKPSKFMVDEEIYNYIKMLELYINNYKDNRKQEKLRRSKVSPSFRKAWK